MKKYKKICMIILVCVICILAVGYYAMQKVVSTAQNTIIHNVDLSQVKDGSYKGEYTIFPVEVVVQVSVENNEIMDIKLLKHVNGLGSSAENITADILQKQTLEVDTVSQATVSSKCMLKAIENALGMEKKI